MKVAIYARVSAKVSAHDQSCEAQLKELRKYVAAREWIKVDEYSDEYISGIKASRPGLDRLMQDVRIRRFDAVLVWKLDRFSRSLTQFVKQIEELDVAGVRFIAVSQGIDTDKSNPMARLFMHLLAAFAEFERQLILERTAAGRAKAKAEGKSLGRPKAIFDRQIVIDLHKEGKSFGYISKKVGISKSLAFKVVKDWDNIIVLEG